MTLVLLCHHLHLPPLTYRFRCRIILRLPFWWRDLTSSAFMQSLFHSLPSEYPLRILTLALLQLPSILITFRVLLQIQSYKHIRQPINGSLLTLNLFRGSLSLVWPPHYFQVRPLPITVSLELGLTALRRQLRTMDLDPYRI